MSPIPAKKVPESRFGDLLLRAVEVSPQDGEVESVGHEAKLRDHLPEGRLEGIEGKVYDLSAVLADQMVMVGLPTQMVDPRPVTEMDMVKHTQLLEDLQGSVHRGEIQGSLRRISLGHDVGGGQMLARGLG